jgi:hypothetical protein
MAANMNASPIGDALMPCAAANPATSKLPTIENIEKAGSGRSEWIRSDGVVVDALGYYTRSE